MSEMDIEKLKAALKGNKIPLLVLDPKWHHLFSDEEKPEKIKEYESQLNGFLQKQGSEKQQLSELKKLKNRLMQGIVDNMGGANETKEGSLQSKKLAENKRLIVEVNEKMDQLEDSLIELPYLIQEANLNLMVVGMEYIYGKMRKNEAEVKEISAWLTEVRIELKKKIIRKQSCEHKNKEMFQYLNAVLGAEVLNEFDFQYEDNFELKKAGQSVYPPADSGGEEKKKENSEV